MWSRVRVRVSSRRSDRVGLSCRVRVRVRVRDRVRVRVGVSLAPRLGVNLLEARLRHEGVEALEELLLGLGLGLGLGLE